MGKGNRYGQPARRQSKKSICRPNTRKLHLERLEERWLLNAQGLDERDPFANTNPLLASTTQNRFDASADSGNSLTINLESLAGGSAIGSKSQNVAWQFE